MHAMARRKLTTRGRAVAAGVCVGVTGLLAGLMAATDGTGSATAGTPSDRATSLTPGGTSSGSGYDGSFDADGDGRVGDPGDYSGTHGQVPEGFGDGGSFGGGRSGTSGQPSFPQPDTRSGGS